MGQSAKNVKNFEVQVDFRWEIKFFLEKSTLCAAINCKVFDQSRKTFFFLKGFRLKFIFTFDCTMPPVIFEVVFLNFCLKNTFFS